MSAAVCGCLWDKKEILQPLVICSKVDKTVVTPQPCSLSTGREDRERGQTNSSSSLSPNLWFVGFPFQRENSQCNSKLPWGLHHYRVGGRCVVLSWRASPGIHTESKHTTKLGRTILAHTSAYQKTGLFGFWNSCTSSVTEAGPSARHCTWQWIKWNKLNDPLLNSPRWEHEIWKWRFTVWVKLMIILLFTIDFF